MKVARTVQTERNPKGYSFGQLRNDEFTLEASEAYLVDVNGIETPATIKDGKIEFEVGPNETYEKLRLKLSTDEVTVLYEAEDESKDLDAMTRKKLKEGQTVTEVTQLATGKSLLNRMKNNAALTVTLTKGRQEVVYKIIAVLEPLPEPRDEGDDYALANSNINSSNLARYLNREELVYIDLREEGPGNGTYLDGYLQGFSNLAYNSYVGKLYKNTAGRGEPANFVPLFEESDEILEKIVASFGDKKVFFMCQSGGRAANILNLLDAREYDTSKYYNVGGWGQYSGDEFNDFKKTEDGTNLIETIDLPALDSLTELVVEDEAA